MPDDKAYAALRRIHESEQLAWLYLVTCGTRGDLIKAMHPVDLIKARNAAHQVLTACQDEIKERWGHLL